jgi:hypothetical protein
MRDAPGPDILSLTVRNDAGQMMGSWLWGTGQPAVVTVMMEEGRLPREAIEAIRRYCDTVLGLMDAALMALGEERHAP